MKKFIALSALTLALSSIGALAAPTTTTWEGQSPIDFNSGNVISAPNNAVIQYHYTTEPITLKNTADASVGRDWGSLKATPVALGNSYVTINGEKYILAQFHFHTESEHTVNGVHTPMEMHLVHLKVHDNGQYYCIGEPGSLLVIGAFINEGAKNNELDKIFGLPGLATLADGATYANPISSINIKKLLPGNGASYRYHGSLTAPTSVSCGASDYLNTNYNSAAADQLTDHSLAGDGSFPEAVSWVVLSSPITMSTAQINVFKTLFPVNADTPEANARPTVNLDHLDHINKLGADPLPAKVRNTDRKVLFIKN